MATTHPLWTGNDASGNTWSLRSDQTLWSYSALAGWSQNTTAGTIAPVLWYAAAQTSSAFILALGGVTAQTSSAFLLALGGVTAASETSTPPPPPPPQVA